MIRQLFYVSLARRSLTQQDVRDILTASRRANSRQDVTGCLLYAGGVFAQVLEGHAAVVSELAGRIRRDDPHSDVRVIVERDTAIRSHGDWSMAFVHDLDLEDALKALLLGDPSVAHAAGIMDRIRPDTVMGAL